MLKKKVSEETPPIVFRLLPTDSCQDNIANIMVNHGNVEPEKSAYKTIQICAHSENKYSNLHLPKLYSNWK